MHTVTLTLELAPSPDALRRLVTACARRRIEIVALRYARREPGGAHAEVEFAGSEHALASARAWIGNLLDVVWLEDAQAMAA